jgi:hypothetical protein
MSRNFFFTKAWLLLLGLLFFPFLLFLQLSSDNLSLEADFSASLLHLLMLPFLFQRSRQFYSCSVELSLTHEFFYALHWWFLLFSLLISSFLDFLIRTVAHY